jgi:hypothetical protein
MAVNKPVGDDRRIGAVRKRSQLKTGETWTKREKQSGEFMAQKPEKPFKGVRKEKPRLRKDG